MKIMKRSLFALLILLLGGLAPYLSAMEHDNEEEEEEVVPEEKHQAGRGKKRPASIEQGSVKEEPIKKQQKRIEAQEALIQAHRKIKKDAERALLVAIARYNLAAVKINLAFGANVNAAILDPESGITDPATGVVDPFKYSALYILLLPRDNVTQQQFPINGLLSLAPNQPLPASYMPNVFKVTDILKLLLSRGADVNQLSGRVRVTPLVQTIHAFPDLVPLLIENGADVLQRELKGRHLPIYYAARTGETLTARTGETLVDTLLTWGARINDPTNANQGPLAVSLKKNTMSLTLWLVQHGAIVDQNGELQTMLLNQFSSPIIKALLAGDHEEVLRMLSDLDTADQEELAFMMPITFSIASGRGYKPVAEYILQHFKSVLNQKDRAQAFYAAVINNHIDLATSIYQSLNSESTETVRKAFITAAAHGYNEILSFMLAQPYNMIDDSTLREAFVRCAYADNLEGARMLFDRLPRSQEGYYQIDQPWKEALDRALWLAALRGHVKMVAFLLERNFNLNLNLNLRAVYHRVRLLLTNEYMDSDRREIYEKIRDLLRSNGRALVIRELVLAPHGQLPEPASPEREPSLPELSERMGALGTPRFVPSMVGIIPETRYEIARAMTWLP